MYDPIKLFLKLGLQLNIQKSTLTPVQKLEFKRAYLDTLVASLPPNAQIYVCIQLS